MYNIVPIGNHTVLYTEKSVKRIDLMLHVHTKKEKGGTMNEKNQ